MHICSKRFVERTGSTATVKVYSNQSTVALYVNGNKVGEQTGEHVFTFKVPERRTAHSGRAGDRTDESVIRHVDTPNPEYKLHKTKSKSANCIIYFEHSVFCSRLIQFVIEHFLTGGEHNE